MLKSDRAIDVNIVIMRAFVRLRRVLATHNENGQELRIVNLWLRDESLNDTDDHPEAEELATKAIAEMEAAM